MLSFNHPSTILVAGPTMSGKTQFVGRVIKTPNMIYPPPTRIVWVYSHWQKQYDLLQIFNPKIEFVNEYQSNLRSIFDPTERNLLVIDDQMEVAGESSTLGYLFTQGSHHLNLTIIYIVQNLFDKGRSMRGVSLNSQYIVVFKNLRDSSQIRNLAQQIYGKDGKFLVDAYKDATENRMYSYLVIDMHPETKDSLRVRTDIFPMSSSLGCTIYVKKGIKGSNFGDSEEFTFPL